MRMKGHRAECRPTEKARPAAEENRFSLGKGYRPVDAASCVLGQRGPRTTLIPAGSQTRSVGIAVSWEALLCRHGEMTLARSANKISLHLALPSPGQPCLADGFFCCSVCLLVWSGAHGYPQHGVQRGEAEGWRTWRREAEVVVVVVVSVVVQACTTHTTTDLPSRRRETCREATRQSCSTNTRTDLRIRATKADRCLSFRQM